MRSELFLVLAVIVFISVFQDISAFNVNGRSDKESYNTVSEGNTEVSRANGETKTPILLRNRRAYFVRKHKCPKGQSFVGYDHLGRSRCRKISFT